MNRYIARRVIMMVPVLIFVSMIAFTITMLLPGDPARAMLGEERANDQVAYQALRQDLGLDRPVPVQYLDWVGRALHGDLGISIRNKQPVAQGIVQRLGPTSELALVAMLLAIFIALPAGILSAVRPNSRLDIVATLSAMSGVAIPHFWLGIMLMLVFAVWLHWLPPSGFISPFEDLGANVRMILLPALTLSTGLAAVVMRQVRSALVEVMQGEYIVTARAKGLQPRIVVSRHALKNALIPVVTIIGLQIGRLFGGAVVVEQVFSIPGIGRLAIDSIFFRDFPMVQAVMLVLSIAVLTANLITDILYAYIDPRIRYQ